jgi:hypothetical protein
METMHNQYTESEVLTVKIIKNMVCWIVRMCNLERAQHFGGTHQAVGCHLFLVCFLPGLFFGPVDGSDMLLQNVTLSPNYTMLQPRKLYPSTNILYR